MSKHYKQAGVDIEAGTSFVDAIKPAVEATYHRDVRGAFGHYGALYSIASLGAEKTLLVSGTDGVGTKLELTRKTQSWDRIGQDLVAMCANDILCLGARPLFFLDYYATGKLELAPATATIKGIARACQKIKCSLIGGETAEMPGLYQAGDFDLAGFIVGSVQEDQVIDGTKIQPGDRVLGLASSGFHANGYSLLRKIIADQDLNLNINLPGATETLGDQLTQSTRLYGPILEPLLKKPELHGLAHITGGGLIGNLPRILPNHCRINLDRTRWQRPALITAFEKMGKIPAAEMVRVFNDGVGMVLIVEASGAGAITKTLESAGESVFDLATVETRGPGEEAVVLL